MARDVRTSKNGGYTGLQHNTASSNPGMKFLILERVHTGPGQSRGSALLSPSVNVCEEIDGHIYKAVDLFLRFHASLRHCHLLSIY